MTNDLHIPDGFWKVPITEVYTDGFDIVFLGIPPTDELDDDDPRAHNCDEMGCGSFGPHVLARYTWPNTMKNLMEPTG